MAVEFSSLGSCTCCSAAGGVVPALPAAGAGDFGKFDSHDNNTFNMLISRTFIVDLFYFTKLVAEVDGKVCSEVEIVIFPFRRGYVYRYRSGHIKF